MPRHVASRDALAVRARSLASRDMTPNVSNKTGCATSSYARVTRLECFVRTRGQAITIYYKFNLQKPRALPAGTCTRTGHMLFLARPAEEHPTQTCRSPRPEGIP